jgi:putative flippase GtrA
VVQVTGEAARRHGAAFAIYLVIGGLSALVEWGVFWVMLHFLPGVDILLDAVVAFIVATFVNYLLCVRTIYASKTGSVLGDIVQVYVASLLAFGVNLVTLWVLARLANVDPMLGKIAGTGTAFLFNFAARQFVIFAPAARPLKAPARQDAAE